MESKNCPQCGNRLFHNKGVSKKNNKPYENFKCGSCDYIEWVDLQAPSATTSPPANAELLEAMRELYTKMEDIERVVISIETKIIQR